MIDTLLNVLVFVFFGALAYLWLLPLPERSDERVARDTED